MNSISSLQNEAAQKLQQLESDGLLRNQKIVTPIGNGRCLVEEQELLDFSSNDYLGYAQHPDVIAATVAAVQKYGVGARASMLISGWSPVHQLLKERLCEFQRTESAMLFSTGYAACQGTVAAMICENDILFCERFNHASLVDGCRMSKAKMRVYRNSRLDVLERELIKAQSYPRRWIVTETLFGMDAQIAPLKELIELAQKYDAFLICDEAHANGLYGADSSGLVLELVDDELFTLEEIAERVPLRIGTLSKSFGSQGGFAVGSQAMMQLLWNKARTAMFSTALSIPACAAAAQAIQLLQNDPNRPFNGRCLASVFRGEYLQDKFTLPGEENCPIVPVVLQNPELTISLASKLEQEGFLVGAIRPPTVPLNSSRLRITITASHTAKDLQQLAKAMIRHNQN